jgi:dipeptidyl aminopeptidase/acylaminoacyl peptidase
MRIGGAGAGTALRAANVGLTLHVPILTGGLVASQVRQAQAQQRATLFDAAAAGREATRATDAAWAALAGAEAQIAANQAGVDAANLALSGVRAEYGFDLRSTLDILVADESLRSAQLALARNHSDRIARPRCCGRWAISISTPSRSGDAQAGRAGSRTACFVTRRGCIASRQQACGSHRLGPCRYHLHPDSVAVSRNRRRPAPTAR